MEHAGNIKRLERADKDFFVSAPDDNPVRSSPSGKGETGGIPSSHRANFPRLWHDGRVFARH
jgi:hypothetical protein